MYPQNSEAMYNLLALIQIDLHLCKYQISEVNSQSSWRQEIMKINLLKFDGVYFRVLSNYNSRVILK